MIVTCSECESSFNVDDGLIKDGGSKVRCSKCSSVFVVHPGTSDSELGVDADDFALETDEDLGVDLESDEEFGDLEIDDPDDELPDLDDMMDFDDDEPAVAAAGEDASGELELDMDLDLDEGEDALSEEMESLDEEEMDLDLEDESMAEADESELGHVEASDDGLLDLDMDLDDLDQVEDADLDLGESDLELDAEEMESAAMETASVQDESDALDLSDLEDLVDSDTDSDLEAVAVEAADDDGLGLDLDAEEMEPAATEAAAVHEESDELDLSDLEDLVGSDADSDLEAVAVEAADDTELDLSDLDDVLETEEEPVQEDITVQASEDLDLDLEPVAEEPVLDSSADLDGADELDLSELDGIMEADEAAAEAVASDDLDEELELDFEVDAGAAETAAVESAEVPDELEMTDLEKMLEPDETPKSEDAEELDLDLDLELEGEASGGGDAGAGDAEFLDIETMLEESEDTAPAGSGAEEPVELDLDAVMAEAAESKESELELNLDLGDDMLDTDGAPDISEPGEEDLEFKLLDSDEETLQFGATQAHATQIDEGLAASSDLGATTDDFDTDDFSETRDLEGQTDIMDQMSPGFPPPVKPRRSRKPVFVVFILLLLSLVGYVVTQNLGIHIPYVSDIKIPYLSDVKIPYLSGLLKSKSQDITGNLKIIPMGNTISHEFIANTAAGDIFVIKGRVRNEYDHPRSHIKITGKLYRRGKALAKTATVYGGNVLTDSDLAKMNLNVINKRLQNRFGDKRSNIKVKAGKTIPFLIVFSKLPANLDEYTVEVSGSSS